MSAQEQMIFAHEQLMSDQYWRGEALRMPVASLRANSEDLTCDLQSIGVGKAIMRLHAELAGGYTSQVIRPGETLPIVEDNEPEILRVMYEHRRVPSKWSLARRQSDFDSADTFNAGVEAMRAEDLYAGTSTSYIGRDENNRGIEVSAEVCYFRGSSSGKQMCGLGSNAIGKRLVGYNMLSVPVVVGEIYSQQRNRYLSRVASAQLLRPTNGVRVRTKQRHQIRLPSMPSLALNPSPSPSAA